MEPLFNLVSSEPYQSTEKFINGYVDTTEHTYTRQRYEERTRASLVCFIKHARERKWYTKATKLEGHSANLLMLSHRLITNYLYLKYFEHEDIRTVYQGDVEDTEDCILKVANAIREYWRNHKYDNFMSFTPNSMWIEEIKKELGWFTLPPPENEGEIPWGTLQIEHAKLENHLAKIKLKSAKRKNTECGVFPGRIDRLLSDGKIFREKTRRKNEFGTILIDCSGSMALDEEDILSIITSKPRCKIAIYAGKDDGDYGVLRVIANNGRFTENVSLGLGGNVVDGPCLRWLMKQNKPRIWISDGQVTGIRDCATYYLDRESKALLKFGKITRYQDVYSYLEDS